MPDYLKNLRENKGLLFCDFDESGNTATEISASSRKRSIPFDKMSFQSSGRRYKLDKSVNFFGQSERGGESAEGEGGQQIAALYEALRDRLSPRSFLARHARNFMRRIP